MKKLLALILALLMMATTVSLAACSKDDEEDPDEDEDYEYNEDTGEDTDKAKETGDEDDTDYDSSNNGEWIDKKDQICVGLNNVVLREGPGRDYSIVATVSNGKVLDRIGTNGNWHKVKYDGQECYVSSSLTTTNIKDFEFENYPEAEQKNLHVKEGAQVNLRSTPFYNEDYAEENLVFSGFKKTETDQEGESLKLIAKSKSGEWYKVSFTGTWGTKTHNGTIVYLKANVAQNVDGLATTSNGSTTLG